MGLNEDPGWRNACVHRLNWLFSKLRPPTIQMTRPVMGEMDISDPSIPGSCSTVPVQIFFSCLAVSFTLRTSPVRKIFSARLLETCTHCQPDCGIKAFASPRSTEIILDLTSN